MGAVCVEGEGASSTRTVPFLSAVCVYVCVLGFVIRFSWRMTKNHFENHWNLLNIFDTILEVFLINRIFSLSLLLNLDSFVALEEYL